MSVQRSFARGFANTSFDFAMRDLPKNDSLESQWSREQGLIPAKVRREYGLLIGEPLDFEVIDIELQVLELVGDNDDNDDTFDFSHQQLELWSDTSFSPSNELLAFWKEGIEYHLPTSRKAEANELSGIFFSTMRKEFSAQLMSTLVEELRFLRGNRPIEFPLFVEGHEFKRDIEIRFSNLFPIKPRSLGSFMELLSRELYEYFRSDRRISADWGSIGLRNGEVIVSLSEDELVDYIPSTKKMVDIDL